MRQALSKYWLIIIGCIATSFITLLLFVILGSFYKASGQTIFINILVWTSLFVVAYYLYYGFHFLIYLASKKTIRKPLGFNGWALLCGSLTILIINLMFIYDLNQSTYISVYIGISGIIATSQAIITIFKKRKKDDDD